MPDIFINTERPVDRSIVAGINQPQREAPAGAYVAGSSYDVNIYFILNSGAYDAASGDAGTDVQLAIAPISEPHSGTWTLTDGNDTTAALDYGASAQEVEDALNALNSDTGPNLGTASLVDVVKQSDTQYTITWRTLGAMTALSGASVSLFPESDVTGSIAVNGDGSEYAQQVIELTRQPAVYQQTWSTIANGHNATVALNTTRLLQAMVLERGQPWYLEVKLDGETVAREVISVEESNMPASAFSGVAIQSLLDAFAADPTSNASFDSVAWGNALSAVLGAVTSVNTQTGAVVLDADDIDDTSTAHKFATTAELTAIADNTSYTQRIQNTTPETATFTATIGETHFVDTSGGGFTADLPAVASGQGRIAFFFTGTGGNLTIDPSGAETIGGKTTLRLDHGHNTIENDGTEWKLVQRSGVTPNRLDPAQITGNQDGYNPTDWDNTVTHLFIDSDASREIQGFEEDGFHDMAHVIVTNDGANDIIIKHDTATTVANRVLVDGGADFTLGANQTGILMRDGTVNKWRFYAVSRGDVDGPASSTDNAVARYDGTTGKLIQDSGVTINDSDDITTTGKVNVGTAPSTLDDINVDGAVLIDHTAAAVDDHALEIDVAAAGFGDVKAVDVAYETGAIATGDDEAIILANIDETSATGGDISAFEVLATEGSADKVNALFVGGGINPFCQLSGNFVDADSVDDNGTDETTALSTGGAGNVAIFTNDNETLTIGSAAKFEEIEIIFDTVASGSGIAPTFECSTGVGTWATFTPVDGTNGARNTGVIAWLDADIPSWAVGTGSEYLIRITRTRNSVGTTPIADKVQILAGIEYCWDKDANVTLNTIEVGNASDTTVSRASAGRLAVEGTEVALMTDLATGLTLVDKTADSNITAVAGEMHVVEMNSGTPFTASRNWTLPVAASVSTGDKFGLMIKDGDAAFEVNVRTGASGDLLNGVDISAASNEWELFQAGEVLIVTCIDGATGDYIVEHDGRIACCARIERGSGQTMTNATYDQVEFITETFNQGMTTDVATNYRITARRAGIFNVSSLVRLSDGDLSFVAGDFTMISVYVDGTLSEPQVGNTGADSGGSRLDSKYNTTYELTSGQYLETFLQVNGTTGADLAGGPSWLCVREII